MIVAFSLTPLGTGEGVADLVAEAVGVARSSGLPCETNAMFTNLEGDWEEVMGVVKTCVDKMAESAPRISLVLKADIRPSRPRGQLQAKVAAIEHRLPSPTQGSALFGEARS